MENNPKSSTFWQSHRTYSFTLTSYFNKIIDIKGLKSRTYPFLLRLEGYKTFSRLSALFKTKMDQNANHNHGSTPTHLLKHQLGLLPSSSSSLANISVSSSALLMNDTNNSIHQLHLSSGAQTGKFVQKWFDEFRFFVLYVILIILSLIYQINNFQISTWRFWIWSLLLPVYWGPIVFHGKNPPPISIPDMSYA